MLNIRHIAALCAVLAIAPAASADERGDAPRVPLAQLRDFSGIEAGGPDTVLVTRGADYAVRVEGDPKAIERLDIYVERNVLHVERKKRRGMDWSQRDKGATVRITLPALHHVALAGSGDMTVDWMGGEAVEAVLSGSGNLSVARIDARRATLSLAGSGNLSAGGTAGNAEVSLAGSGDVLAERMASDTATVSVAGSGNATIRATGKASVSIIGSGNATVKGTHDCQVSRIGSGNARCVA